MREPNIERSSPAGLGGVQKLYRFENGFGASVVKSFGSYGNEQGLWEIAVLKFTGPDIDNFELTYTTSITEDVIGHLSEGEVDEYLTKIEALSN